MVEHSKYPSPPRPLLTRNPLLWFSFFGPGAVIASLTVGSGELLFPSRMGAIFGYRLLWIFPLAAFLKWILAYSSARHMILSGAHPLERWKEVPGPRGWLPLFFFSIFFICNPFWASLQTGLLGGITASIFPHGDMYFWATVCVIGSLVLLVIGNYRFLERAQMMILGVMLVCILVAVFYVQPPWWQVLKGLLLPQIPEYPGWVLDKYHENFSGRSQWLELTVAISVIGGAAGDYIFYVSMLREKQWGRSSMGIAGDEELTVIDKDPHHVVRIWVRAAMIDTVLSMMMVIVIATSFCVLSSIILLPQQIVPAKDSELLLHQSQFLTQLSPALLPVYQLAVFLAFFGNVYGGPEMASGVFNEYSRVVPGIQRRWSANRIRWFAIVWTLFGGLAIVWITRALPGVGLVEVATFPAIYASILLCGFYCFANTWADRRFLPQLLRMPRFMMIFNILAGLIFAVIGVKAMWDHTYWHFIVLPVWILASMWIASKLR